MQAMVRTESRFNPYAIGVVGGHLASQPLARSPKRCRRPKRWMRSASTSAWALARSIEPTFLNTASPMRLRSTFAQTCKPAPTSCAAATHVQPHAWPMRHCEPRFRGYLGGNFTRGLKADFRGTSYVQRVSANAQATSASIDVPAIPVAMDRTSSTPTRQARSAAPRFNAANGSQAAAPTDAASDTSHPSWDAFGDYACDRSASCN